MTYNATMNVTQEKLSQIDTIYRPGLKHLELEANSRTLVVFSGAINMGKTTLAKKLEQALHAVRIENDAIRRVIESLWPAFTTEEVNEFKNEYVAFLLKDLLATSKNQSWVLDASVDRSFNYVKHFASEHSFQIVLIAFDLSPQEHERRSRQSSKEYAGIRDLTRRTVKDQENFLVHMTPDIVVTDSTDIEADVIRPVGDLIKPKVSHA